MRVCVCIDNLSCSFYFIRTQIIKFCQWFSVNSNSSLGSTKYDPDLLKADINLAKNRVGRLKRELEQIKAEMVYKEQGVETLCT